MLSFTKEEIDAQRQDFIGKGYPKRQVRLDKRTIDFFVLPEKIFQVNGIHVPNGLFRMTGNVDDGYLVGVSAEVPLMIRGHFAMSEHDEFVLFGLDDNDRTLHSEQSMLSILQGYNYLGPCYIGNKLVLYNHILQHAKGNLGDWRFTEDDYQGFIRARDFLLSQK